MGRWNRSLLPHSQSQTKIASSPRLKTAQTLPHTAGKCSPLSACTPWWVQVFCRGASRPTNEGCEQNTHSNQRSSNGEPRGFMNSGNVPNSESPTSFALLPLPSHTHYHCKDLNTSHSTAGLSRTGSLFVVVVHI